MTRIISTVGIVAMFALYCISGSPSRDVILVAAIIVAISDAADRISRRSEP